jgi:hypothetical protein
MNTNDATRANAEGMSAATPIQLLYREWAVKHRHTSKGGFTEDDASALCAEMDEFADKLLVLPAASPLDVIAKFLAASDNMEMQTRDEWADSIREEAIAFVEGAPDAGQIIDPSRLSMNGLFNLHDALTTVFHVLSGLVCQPRFISDRHVVSPAGEMLDKLSDFVAGALEAVHNEACARPVTDSNEAERKFFFLANRVVDGLTDPAYAMEELSKSAASLVELRS